MRPPRASIIGAILYVVLAGGWILSTSTRLIDISRAPVLAAYIGYFVIITLGVVMATIIVLDIRRLRASEGKRADLEQASRRLQLSFDALARSTDELDNCPDLASKLNNICRHAALGLSLKAATLSMYYPQRGQLELAAAYGLPEELRKAFPALSYSGAYFQNIAQDGLLLISTSDPNAPTLPFGNLYRQAGFKTLVYLPLRHDHEHEFVGEFTILDSQEGLEFTPEQSAFMIAMADQAMLAIANDRLSGRLSESDRRLEILRAGDIAILSSLDLNLTLQVFLQQVVSQLQVDAADVLLFDPGTQILEYAAGMGFRTSAIKESRVALGTGFAGKIALERRSMYLSDVNLEGPFSRRNLLFGESVVSYFGCPLIAKGQVKGVLEVFQRRSFYPPDHWLSFLETLAGQAAIAIDNATLFSNLQRLNAELSIAYDRTLEGWSRALDLRDRETEGHTQRVADLSVRLAKECNVREADMIHLRRGALLHDIGKMGIPDQILHKPGELTVDELKIMKRHPTFAFEMLSPIAYLQPALDIPYCHHERWDGTGYPRGLQGEVIPLAARVFAVVDVWDALTTERPYRKALTPEAAFQYLREQAGRQFDSQIVDVFLRMMQRGATPVEVSP